MNNSEQFMRRAIELAHGGEGWTNPNPLVGAVIVKDGKIIGEGFHKCYGDLHAEREALADCERRGNSPAGAEVYVTLEPCAHLGKQPPCCRALVEAGISKVYVGSRDPNPLVAGKGNAFLRENGIEVTEDFLRSECDELNPVFFKFITSGLPYVALKYAMTLDGKIATHTEKSKWITGEKSREFVQKLRNRYASILCGIGTVLKDDPLLTARIEGAKNPVRIIMDSSLRIPPDSQIIKTAESVSTIIVCGFIDDSLKEKKRQIESAGAEVLSCPGGDGQPDFNVLMKVLGQRKIDSILIEGGAEINFSALSSGIVNHVYAFVAPKIFGGKGAKSPVGGLGVDEPDEAFKLKLKKITQFDDDLLLEYDRV